MKEVFIHYCGGCNPRYDRTQLVQQLQSAFPHFSYVYQAEHRVDLALVICGCSAACPAKHEENAAKRFVVTDATDRATLNAALSAMDANAIDSDNPQ